MKNIIKKTLIGLKLYNPLVNIYNKFIYSFPSLYLSKDELALYKNKQKIIKQQLLVKKRLLKFYKGFLKKGALIFDIGANVGLWTEVYLELGASKVIAVEPQQSMFNTLREKFANNEKIIILPKAVGEREGYAELAICEDFPGISTMSKAHIEQSRFSKEYSWGKRQNVEITTLDDIITLFGTPDYCKIDVEGYELNVVKGLSKALPMISFEFHKEFIEDAVKICEYLSSLGMHYFNFSKGERMKFVFKNWVNQEDLLTYLKTQNEVMLWGDIYVATNI